MTWTWLEHLTFHFHLLRLALTLKKLSVIKILHIKAILQFFLLFNSFSILFFIFCVVFKHNFHSFESLMSLLFFRKRKNSQFFLRAVEDSEQVYLFSIYIRIIFFSTFFLVNYLSGKRAFVFGFFFRQWKTLMLPHFFLFLRFERIFFLFCRNCCKIGLLFQIAADNHRAG